MRFFVKSDADPRKPYVRVEGEDLSPSANSDLDRDKGKDNREDTHNKQLQADIDV